MLATVTSDWPTPTVSTNTTSKPAASTTTIVSRVARATPPRTPDDGDGRMNARSSTDSRDIRVLSPRMLPPVRVDDGSTASTATRLPLAVRSLPRASTNVDLPGPGHAGDADAVGAAGLRQQPGQQLLGRLLVVAPRRLDERDGPAERRAVGGEDAGLVGVEVDGRPNGHRG